MSNPATNAFPADLSISFIVTSYAAFDFIGCDR
jgi:hypothetical protein